MSNVSAGPASIQPSPEMRVRPEPRTTFRLAGEDLTIKHILDEKSGRIALTGPSEAEQAFQGICRYLGNSGVNYERYMKTMPRLLEAAANPDGTVTDEDLCLVIGHKLVQEAKLFLDPKYRELNANYIDDPDKKNHYLSEVEGQIRCLKLHIWNHPDGAEIQKGLASRARTASENGG